MESLQERQLAADSVNGNSCAPDLAELVDRLAARPKTRRLYRVAPVESEVPERSVRKVVALAEASDREWPAVPRPCVLLQPPEPVLANPTRDPPQDFTWRGRSYRVRLVDGPERVYGEWWVSDDEIAAARDYYFVEDEDGRRFWLFLDAPAHAGGRWWIQGLGG